MLTEEQRQSFEKVNKIMQQFNESCKLVTNMFKEVEKAMSGLSEAIKNNPSLLKVCEANNMVIRLRKLSKR